jgi:hypothetical protein
MTAGVTEDLAMDRAGRKATVVEQLLGTKATAPGEPKLSLVESIVGKGPPAAQPVADAPAGEGEADPAATVDAPAYGFVRGRGQGAPFLEFQRRKQEWLGASYADLRRTRWAPSGGDDGPGSAFVLEFRDGLKVLVRGRNLRVVLEGVLRGVVVRITEMGEEADRFLPEDAVVVYAIEPVEPEDP